MAFNILGAVAEEFSVEEITGTVKEMLNMLAGNSLSTNDPEASFNLRIPKIAAFPTEAERGRQEKSSIFVLKPWIVAYP